MNEKLMTVEEVAEFLNVNPMTVYRMLKRRAIPAYKVANQWRFERAELNAWLARNRVDADSDIA